MPLTALQRTRYLAAMPGDGVFLTNMQSSSTAPRQPPNPLVLASKPPNLLWLEGLCLRWVMENETGLYYTRDSQ
eukprot:364637-Chlamydomonas_euryale.AAC.4